MSEIIFKKNRFTWNISVYSGYFVSFVVFLYFTMNRQFNLGLFFGVVISCCVCLWKLGRDKTIYTLTDESLIIEMGILNKTLRKIPLSKIQDVTLKQGFIQKQFNTGDLFVESAGERSGGMPIQDVPDPHKTIAQILEITHKKT